MATACELCNEPSNAIYCATCIADQDRLAAERPDLTEQDLDRMAEQAAWHLSHNATAGCFTPA